MKDKNDSRTYLTEADTAGQELIWNGLRAVFGPRLTIVGEEDVVEEENEWKIKNEPEVDEFDGYDIPTDLQELVFADVVVFIDPVDGTREFVEGRLGACQNLIGISYRGRAVAGVVGLPFYRYCTDLCSMLLLSSFSRPPTDESAICCGNTETRIIFGVVGTKDGVYGLPDCEDTSHAEETEVVL